MQNENQNYNDMSQRPSELPAQAHPDSLRSVCLTISVRRQSCPPDAECAPKADKNGRVPGWGLGLAAALLCLAGMANAATFTNDTLIDVGNTNWEGQGIIVDNCTLTVNGSNSFASLLLTNGAVLNHSPAPNGETNNRIDLTITGDLTVGAGCRIDVNGLGYSPANGPAIYPSSPEAGLLAGLSSTNGGGGGGGYGGNGGDGVNALEEWSIAIVGLGGRGYGSIVAPANFGSGGGNGINSMGGAGGGALRLAVAGTLHLDGEISANGHDATGDTGGGGAGGSIWLDVGTLAGSGIISAKGGAGQTFGGGGGGGRIAIEYDGANQFIGTNAAFGGSGFGQGGAGTIHTKQTAVPAGHVLVDNGGQTNGVTWLFASQLREGGTFPDLTVSGAALFKPGISGLWSGCGTRVDVNDHVTLNRLTMKAGAQLSLGDAWGDDIIRLMVLGDARIDETSGMFIDGRFSIHWTGDIAGWRMIRLTVGGILHLDGVLSAKGADAQAVIEAGGTGALVGGNIRVTARKLLGTGVLRANGGNGNANPPDLAGRGADGGYIAVYSLDTNEFTGSFSVAGGQGSTATNGGQAGLILVSNTFPPLRASGSIIRASGSDCGTNRSAATGVELAFSEALAPGGLTAGEITVVTPNGPLLPEQFTVTALAGSVYAISFPTQSTEGLSILSISSQARSVFGVELDQNANGTAGEDPCDGYWLPFVVGPQKTLVAGRVTAGGCHGVEGVSVLAEPGGLSSTTDTDGYYVIPLPWEWRGTVAPSLTDYVFEPSFRSYDPAEDADFRLALPPLFVTATSSTLRLEWQCAAGLNYWLQSSETLTNWTDCAGPFAGANSLMWFEINLTSQPKQFFRLRADRLP